jgi:hypothetical protein
VDLFVQITRIIKAWRVLRPQKSYGGFSLEDFEKLVAPSGEARAEAALHDAKWREAKLRMKDADAQLRKYVQRVVNGVKADPEDGEDGELYTQMGYVPRAVRNSLRSLGRRNAAAKALDGNPTDSKSMEVRKTEEAA